MNWKSFTGWSGWSALKPVTKSDLKPIEDKLDAISNRLDAALSTGNLIEKQTERLHQSDASLERAVEEQQRKDT